MSWPRHAEQGVSQGARADARKRLQAQTADAPETYTVEQIRRAFARHASPDDWGVPSFYEGGLIEALRGKYDEPTRVIQDQL